MTNKNKQTHDLDDKVNFFLFVVFLSLIMIIIIIKQSYFCLAIATIFVVNKFSKISSGPKQNE